MLIVNKNVQVECEICKKIHYIMPKFECIASNDRNMGLETFYESYDEFVCSNCGSQLFIGIQVCEYPENTLNNVKYDCKNINVCERIDLDFIEL